MLDTSFSLALSKNKMTPFYDFFCKHPEEEGMTYLQHLQRAICLSSKMAYGSICLFIHGLIPCFHERTGTYLITELYHDIHVKNK